MLRLVKFKFEMKEEPIMYYTSKNFGEMLYCDWSVISRNNGWRDYTS
jgi:hypothetical protein